MMRTNFLLQLVLLAVASASQGDLFTPSDAISHTPSGTYKGTTKKLGETVTGIVTIVDDSHFDINVQASGVAKVDVNCKDEEFKLAADGTVTLPNVNTKGNCLHDALEANKVTLKKVTYDSKKDTINIAIVGTHRSEEDILSALMAAEEVAATHTPS